jgi:hypothetical protein
VKSFVVKAKEEKVAQSLSKQFIYVTFIDTLGSTISQLDSVTIDSSGNAILSGVVLNGLGKHTITVSYAGISNTCLANSKGREGGLIVSITTIGDADCSCLERLLSLREVKVLQRPCRFPTPWQLAT